MKLSKTLVLPIAGLLVTLGAGAVLATTGMPVPRAGAAVVPAAATPTPTPSPATRPLAVGSVTAGVLDDLVAKGTITAAQKSAILDALQAKRDSIKADRQAARDAARQQLQQIRGFLSDGQITQEELDQLPADSPLRQMTSLLDDGKITIDELRSVGRGLLRDLAGAGARGRGNGMFRGGFGLPNLAPSPAPSAATGG